MKPISKINIQQINVEINTINSIPVHSPIYNQITDDTLICYYKGSPIFIEFLYSESGSASFIYFEKIKNNLILNKWGSMNEKDKIYYLNNKIHYYYNLIDIKEISNDKFENMIKDKNKEINDLQQLIFENEKLLTQTDNMKINEKANKIEIKLNEFSKINLELDDKIKNCDQLIKNYENPTDGGLHITEIINGLNDEKKRLKKEITKQNDIVKELDERIKQLNEFIKILEIK